MLNLKEIAPGESAPIGTLSGHETCYGAFSYDYNASACFVPYGEHLWICDEAADGHHPAARYRINGGSWKLQHAYPGNGYCQDFNLSIAEGGYIEFEPRNYEKTTTVISYGPIVTVYA